MKTFAEFKAEIGVQNIDLKVNDKGREMAWIKDTLLLVAKTCDFDKDVYVNQLTKDKHGNEIKEKVFVAFNTTLKASRTV